MPQPGGHENNPTSSASEPSPPLSSSFYIPSAISHSVTGLLRRFSTDPSQPSSSKATQSPVHSPTFPNDAVYVPRRTASPFQPPPLYPITLKGYQSDTAESAHLLSKTLAEEIRLLVPPRLQLCEEWNLLYSLDQDGVSLATLYKKCDELRGLRNGFVLVVKDGDGGLFGAYLTEAPHPSPHYFGTGECFLWRAAILRPSAMMQNLPPPPSADTTQAQRTTTLGTTSSPSPLSPTTNMHPNPYAPSVPSLLSPQTPTFPSGASTPERIRFKAFPYSGVNDYLMLCETGFLSIGGGDGKYGLWLDDSFEKGISSHCLTFGNEPLSEEGDKFDIIGVELWSIGNLRE
ncbi:putative oxidation resistance protein 1 [Coleophoma crateriformis]|uniref:Oxidation resistance protein 1 n=1 Tax=Coleophoma crateriformis TaxID=565419 RepID=A0A3D8RI69_9HELO|nr:putative oxidation resistance protein 1 [Coleophoma crateriformis]